jgi:hypothetical protein
MDYHEYKELWYIIENRDNRSLFSRGNKGQFLQYNKGYAIFATWPDHFLMRSLNVRTRSQKDKAMYEAHLQYSYIPKDIAEYIGVHYTTVSRAIKKFKGKMKSDIARPKPLLIKNGSRSLQLK